MAACVLNAPLPVNHLPIQLCAIPSRMVIRPFVPADEPLPAGRTQPVRAQCLADRVLDLGEPALHAELARGAVQNPALNTKTTFAKFGIGLALLPNLNRATCIRTGKARLRRNLAHPERRLINPLPAELGHSR